MIKKLIGIIVAVAVIVIVVIAAIRRDNFQSMLLRDEIENQTFPEPVVTGQPAAPVAGEIEVTDSVTVEVVDSIRFGNTCPESIREIPVRRPARKPPIPAPDNISEEDIFPGETDRNHIGSGS